MGGDSEKKKELAGTVVSEKFLVFIRNKHNEVSFWNLMADLAPNLPPYLRH